MLGTIGVQKRKFEALTQQKFFGWWVAVGLGVPPPRCVDRAFLKYLFLQLLVGPFSISCLSIDEMVVESSSRHRDRTRHAFSCRLLVCSAAMT